ncbi:unnamed protein product [Linum tenue]|uniref:Uncharacterized protein n=1 Tax=Linum tenue TaxID=586396 RepID=A0AAV0K4M3_9ROSI|nr:unnamed protein product [Linum tenue]
MVVIRNPQKCKPVANQIDRGHGILDHRPREGNQQPILDNPGHIHGQRRRLAHQQEHGEVQGKSTERIRPKHHEIEMETRRLPENRVLDEDPRDKQENQAARGNIVQRSNRIQGNPFRSQQDLNQYQSCGLERDRAQLQHHPPDVEPRLAVRGNRDADGDREHVGHGVGLEALPLERNADGVDGDGHQGFQHLDEGDGEVDVGGIGQPEGERVERPDWDDGGEVHLPRH